MGWVSEKNSFGIHYTTGENGSYDDRLDESIEYGMSDGLNW